MHRDSRVSINANPVIWVARLPKIITCLIYKLPQSCFLQVKILKHLCYGTKQDSERVLVIHTHILSQHLRIIPLHNQTKQNYLKITC